MLQISIRGTLKKTFEKKKIKATFRCVFAISGIFLGEALLPLEDIAVTDMNKNLADLPQLLLPLTKPSEHGKKEESMLLSRLSHSEVNPKYTRNRI